jgi:hypothetical protein
VKRFSTPPQLPVSLIIPCGADVVALAPVLASVAAGSCWPAEVLVVDAAKQLQGWTPSDEPFAFRVRVLEDSEPLFPGAARNLGCQAASQNWLAFLDLNTLPPPQWLEAVYASAQQHLGVELVLGATRYRSQGWQQRLFISATYGERALSTLPGSLVHRSVFSRVGGFLPGIRAGEDTDWLVRVNQFAIAKTPGIGTPLTYSALPTSLLALACKWFRNYRSCAPVVFHLEAQKTIYVVIANLLIMLVAFRWNALVAGWQESNFFYVANISKMAIYVLVLFYLIIRGLLMPLHRGSLIQTLLPLRWIAIGFVCVVLDVSKLLAFVSPPWRNRSMTSTS